jgi:hypothetical protein
MSQGSDAVGVLLALGHKHGGIGEMQQVGQPVEHPAYVAEPPYPAAPAVRPALSEVFRLIAQHLVEHLAAGVDVIVGFDDLRLLVGLRCHRGHDRLLDLVLAPPDVLAAVEYEGRQPGFLADVIATFDGVVVGK